MLPGSALRGSQTTAASAVATALRWPSRSLAVATASQRPSRCACCGLCCFCCGLAASFTMRLLWPRSVLHGAASAVATAKQRWPLPRAASFTMRLLWPLPCEPLWSVGTSMPFLKTMCGPCSLSGPRCYVSGHCSHLRRFLSGLRCLSSRCFLSGRVAKAACAAPWTADLRRLRCLLSERLPQSVLPSLPAVRAAITAWAACAACT